MRAIGIADKAKVWNPALNMCILCCHAEKGNACKSLSCFSIKEGELVLTLPTPDLSVQSKPALGSALLCAYSNNMEHLSCAIDGWHTIGATGNSEEQTAQNSTIKTFAWTSPTELKQPFHRRTLEQGV